MHKDKQPLLDEIVRRMSDRYDDLKGVYLFGTFGTDYQRADSDLDIAILLGSSLDNLERWDFAQDLSVASHIDVDLIDLRAASTVLRYVVLTEGKRIACFDEEVCDRFELQAISRYLHFNEARKGLLP